MALPNNKTPLACVFMCALASAVTRRVFFSVCDGSPCCSFCVLWSPALCIGALLCSPLTCLMYCRCCCCTLHFLNTVTLGKRENKRARIATANFEGTERKNSTHTAHTHIYMLSRVAAVMAPRTHNRRGVTGSSGRRREGGESESQRPNMSRRVFDSAVLLLVTTMCCATCGATAARENDGNSDLRSVEELQKVDLFVPQTTPVLPEGGGTPGTKRDAFASPSLVSAGGVLAAFARGEIDAQYAVDGKVIKPTSSDIVAGYIDSSWDWFTLVEKVSGSTWKAHTVLDTTDGTNRVGDVFNPTTTTKGNKVFLLAGSYDMLNESGRWKRDSLDLKLVVGDVTKPTASEPSGWITWGTPTSLGQTTLKTPKAGLKDFASSGGSGVLMEDGTLVFPVMAKDEAEDVYSMIIYSTNNGSTWSLSEGTSPAKCETPASPSGRDHFS
ncbi:hypothetical protein TCDM_12147 [Trypanosoma cruzi Dm28c]|uniref:Sialidase domain-containing protein n=1 Tax=Trypanosoma cruzi Dm28c TaxID=1416333 RepID=V5CYM4_TRYCR|nr:hypothetical protein TCDM_12147 [Trypanosoma cruzi Dm28c]